MTINIGSIKHTIRPTKSVCKLAGRTTKFIWNLNK